MEPTHVDVLIVGAGLSGIAAAYYLQTRRPDDTYCIIEARDDLGGTWDLFRYPGIRSDSDMYTLGYSFRPWPGQKWISDGESIREYIRATAEEYGIDEKIRFGLRVVTASWSSEDARWTVRAEDTAGEEHVFTCTFLWGCTGYYRYDAGYEPDFPGEERFEGRIIHPQKWTEDVDYAGEKVVVIGSGATAITLVPAMAKKAEHVVMLQRSPSYLLSLPSTDSLAKSLERWLPLRLAYAITRWKNVLGGLAFYLVCQYFPNLARRGLKKRIRRALSADVDVDTHFEPRYDPWDERVCVVPDDDFFEAINEGRASIVTDHIETFTEDGIALRSGEEIEADMIVTATGLRLLFFGGIELEIDGEPIDPAEQVMYRGAMLSGVPNAALSFGYINASWTLKCEITCDYVTRLLDYMDEHGYEEARPRYPVATVEEYKLMDLSAGYIERALDELPTQGLKHPWRMYQNYPVERLVNRLWPVDDGVLELR